MCYLCFPGKEAEQRYSKLCRTILNGIDSSGASTPRAALINTSTEVYNIRKQWRTNASRQRDETGEGLKKVHARGDQEHGVTGAMPDIAEAGDVPSLVPKGPLGCVKRRLIYGNAGSGLHTILRWDR